ncbi:MAG: hypothetical protein ACOH5I_07625 [Oligoflexus sp.]
MKIPRAFLYLSLACLPLFACGRSSKSNDRPTEIPTELTDDDDVFVPAQPGALPGHKPSPFDPNYGFVDVDFSRYAAVLLGHTSEYQHCYLAVLSFASEESAAIVETNFEFNTQNPGPFFVQPSKNVSYLLVGKQSPSPSLARLDIITKFQSQRIEDAREYRVYWQADGQSVRGECTALRVVQ